MGFQGLQSLPVKFDPKKDWGAVRGVLTSMQQNLADMMGILTTPRQPQSLLATAASFANIIKFIKTNGDRYELMVGPTANLKDGYLIDIGDTGYWVDYIGINGILRFYWVRAVNIVGSHSRVYSDWLGPTSATTLTIAAAVAPPAFPYVGDQPVLDNTTGFLVQNTARG